jgi:putative MATE family efflux protein
VALNSMQVVNTLLDRAFIGHLPTEALTAHGGSMNVMFLMFSLAVSLATGATALVSRAYGAGEKREFRHASRQAVAIAIAVGFLTAILTMLTCNAAAGAVLPSDDPKAIVQMGRFLFVYGMGLPAIYVIQALAGCLRGIGDTKSPMVISGFQILMHICLNFLLVFPTRQIGGVTIPGAGWGLVGAAAALGTSAWLASIVYLLYSGRTPLGSLWRVRFPEKQYAMRILRIAAPAALMSMLRVFSLTAFTLILSLVPDGSDGIAAMGIGFSIESIMFMPAFGLSMAASALVGQSLGMKRPDRAERLGWTAAHHAALVTLSLVTPIYLLSPQIATLLLGDKTHVIQQATELIRWLCLTEVLFSYAMVLLGAMQGAGDTVRPLWITVFSLWGIRVPLAFFLAVQHGHVLFGHGDSTVRSAIGLGIGASGAWIALSITQSIQGVLSILAFRQGAWKLKKV